MKNTPKYFNHGRYLGTKLEFSISAKKIKLASRNLFSFNSISFHNQQMEINNHLRTLLKQISSHVPILVKISTTAFSSKILSENYLSELTANSSLELWLTNFGNAVVELDKAAKDS